MARWLYVTAAKTGGWAIATVLVFAAPLSVQSQPAVDWTRAQPFNIILIDDRFMPDKLTFRHGVAYQLHLENHGKELHEFTAADFFAASVVRDPTMLANGGQDVVVQPGTTANLYLMPLKPGNFRLICADHDWDGMVGEITVE